MNEAQARGRERHQNSFMVYQPERIEAARLTDLLQSHGDLSVVDEYDGMLEELFQIENPALKPRQTDYFDRLAEFRAVHYGGQAPMAAGSWFYYPWRNAVVHALPQSLHNRVRTNRNRDFITDDEQQKLRQTTIGVAGLSVGSNVLMALTLMGQYQRLKIADADVLSLGNLNRLYGSVADLNVPKTTLAARKIYERDPEADVAVFAEGLNEHNLDDFLDGVDMVFDEIDDVGMKARLRLAARERQLPVIMMTDSGDSGILDIERYDLFPEQELFHGRLTKEEIDSLLTSRPDQDKWLQLVAKIIGIEHMPSRLLQSLPKIGRELAGAPQLGTAAMVSGGIGAFVARMIALGEPLKTGKIPLVVEANILKDYDGEQAKRAALLEKLSG